MALDKILRVDNHYLVGLIFGQHYSSPRQKMHPKNDQFLVWARAHYGWLVERMRGLDAGELALFVRLYIVDRWMYTRKPSYAYEIAWVFERDRGTVGNALHNLEQSGEIRTLDRTPKERRTLYHPTAEDEKIWLSWAATDKNDEDTAWINKIHDENCPCKRR